MSIKKSPKFGRLKAFFAGFLVFIGMLTGVGLFSAPDVAAIPDEGETSEITEETSENNSESEPENQGTVDAEEQKAREQREQEQKEQEEKNATTEEATAEGTGENDCRNSLGSMEWVVCAITDKVAKATDFLYKMIESLLVINPVPAEDGSPIYEIWKYCRGLTNIIFIIFLLVVIYSQLTGIGISNYGLKKALPKLIIAAIMVNLSFLICSLAVDVSNILGDSLRGTFEAVEESTLATSEMENEGAISFAEIYSAMAAGAPLAIGGAIVAFEAGSIWMFIPMVLGAIVSVAAGLITIALRQAVVVLLIMVAPLAMVSNIMPNTEQWFKKWKDLLMKMLIFYPMFSLLFGASSLAGLAIMMSASDGFGVMLGAAVQVFPLFFAWSMMKMSGTFLNGINAKMHSLASGPLAYNRSWADSHRELSRRKHIAARNAYTPSLALMQYLSDRKVAREEELDEHAKTIKNRGLAYNAARKYKNGVPTKEAEEEYEAQARNMKYEEIIERHKNNMNKGLGQLEAVKTRATEAQKVRLGELDMANVGAADTLFAEKARGEKVEYDNAMGRYQRFEEAINAHMDDVNRYITDKDGNKVKDEDYKFHFDPNDPKQAIAMARYNDLHQIMEGNVSDTQFVAAAAAQGYDTQMKMYTTKMQKYFDLTPPSKDVIMRLNEITEHSGAADKIDTVVSGLRVVNQRGDTDLVKEQIDNLLDKEKGGGIELGTHASQSIASFLMFEMKDSDPMLRRFGKYINLETANVYNKNNRKEMYVNYDEYLKGYHEEPDGSIMYAKKDVKKLLEGTSLDNIERTALGNLDDSLKQAYGFDKNNKSKPWEVDKYLKRREDIQTAFEPAFLSSSMKWLSGSEQINSGVKFWTGYELKQKKDDKGKVVLDLDGNPEFDLIPVWESGDFKGHEDEVEKFFRRKTSDFFKDQTTGQILNMRTDYRDATMEHLLASYLADDSDDETPDEKRQKYEAARAEIQTRYADEDAKTAAKKRKKDLHDLKMELAGRYLRKILGNSGKLKQIYRTRSSGTAINAKDWLRKWVDLDDEKALRKEVDYYEKEKAKARASSGEADDVVEGMPRVYTEEDQVRFVNEVENLRNRIKDEDTEAFYDDMRLQVEEWFGSDSVIEKKFEDYYKVDNPDADNNDLYEKLKELLNDLKNYPDA